LYVTFLHSRHIYLLEIIKSCFNCWSNSSLCR